MARNDATLIRNAAAGRWKDILISVGGCPADILDGNHHPCPKCGGSDRFRYIDEKMGALFCNGCFNKKNGDGISAVGWLLGIEFREACEKLKQYLGLATVAGAQDPARDLEPIPWSSELVAFYVQAKPGVTEEAIIANGGQMFRYKRSFVVIGWPIIGETLDVQSPVGWVIVDVMGGKLPKWDKDGNVIGSVNSKLTRFSQPGLLGTWGITRIKTVGLVTRCHKVEGVTDLLACWSKIPASERERQIVVSNANGAEEKPRWRASVLARLPDVRIVQDADEPGVAGAVVWCQEIAAQDGRVRNVVLPYDIQPNHGKDLRDWFNEGADYSDLVARGDQAEQHAVARNPDGTLDVAAAQYPIQEKILKALQLEILYENDQGHIRVFSSCLRKSSWIRQIARLKVEELIQICGAPALAHVTTDPAADRNEFSMTDVRRAIAYVASQRREQQNERGIGIWQGVDPDNHESDVLVLVGDSEAVRWNGQKELTRVHSPRSDGLVMDFGSGQQDWFDFEELGRLTAQAGDPAWTKAAIDHATNIFSRWRWRSDAAPLLMTGLVMATWVQSIWTWRPLVSITGESNSGKSLLFDALGGNQWRVGIFGRLAFKQSKSTEAGLRQGIGNTSRILLCDEFEAGKERDRILEALRLSTRGDQTARGTGGDGRGKSYGMRHIAYVAAIETGLERQPDTNRFVHLELLRAEKGKDGQLRLPENGELSRLGQKLLAAAIYHGLTAKKIADKIKETRCEGIDGRTVEVYAVPAAILAVALGGSEAAAVALLRDLVTNAVEKDSQGATDHEDLLSDILGAAVNCGSKLGASSVGQIADSHSTYMEYAYTLESYGVKLEELETGRHLVIATRIAKSRLLKGTQWERQRIDQILLRMPGAFRSHARMAGGRPRTITVPYPNE